MSNTLYETLAANGSTDEVVRHSDVVLTVTNEGGTLSGSLTLEEWVPGKGWVVRATVTAVGHTTVVANKTDPTRWRATMASYVSGTWGVSIR
jgi:hypothetical protein